MPYCSPNAHDAAINYIKNNVDKGVLCSQVPTTFTQANVTYALADVALVDTDISLSNAPTTGRRMTVAGKTGVTVDVEGDPVCYVLLDTIAEEILYIFDETGGQTLYAGNPCTIPQVVADFNDPVNA